MVQNKVFEYKSLTKAAECTSQRRKSYTNMHIAEFKKYIKVLKLNISQANRRGIQELSVTRIYTCEIHVWLAKTELS